MAPLRDLDGRMSNPQRLEKKIDDLQQQWELLNEKLSGLKKQRILESRAEERLRLETLIKETESECNQVEQELEVLNNLRSEANSNVSEAVGRNDNKSQLSSNNTIKQKLVSKNTSPLPQGFVG